jgi:hypothetical protein
LNKRKKQLDTDLLAVKELQWKERVRS